jgi:hypothetical protein
VREHRRYTRKQKLTAVVAAEMTSQEAAAEATGIPRTTLAYWMDAPEFVALRQNAREAMANEAMTVARLAWGKLAEAIKANQLEPRDLVLATGMATDKAQLLNGMATARTESRDISGTLADAELIAAIAEADRLTTAGEGRAAPATEGTPEG